MKKVALFLVSVLLSACGSTRANAPDSITTLTAPVVPVNNVSILPVPPTKKVRNVSVKANQILRLNGEIGENVNGLIKKIEDLNRKKAPAIYILIDSPGGSVFDGLRLVTTMEASRVPVYTVCMAMCASMAAIIHQYGTKRFMQDRSRLMFHDASGGLQGTLHQMKTRLDYIIRTTDKTNAYIAQRAGMTVSSFSQQIIGGPEIWVDAEDSTSKHFNDEIVYITVEGKENDVFMLPFPATDKSADYYKFKVSDL